MLKDGSAAAVVAGCEAELDAAAGVNDGKSVADGAGSPGCEVDAEAGWKLNLGAAAVAAGVAALVDAGVDWALPPRLKPEKEEAAGLVDDSVLDDTAGKMNNGF